MGLKGRVEGTTMDDHGPDFYNGFLLLLVRPLLLVAMHLFLVAYCSIAVCRFLVHSVVYSGLSACDTSDRTHLSRFLTSRL